MYLSGKSESNRIAQHEGREYRMVKAIARRWGLENANEDIAGERFRSVWVKEYDINDVEEAEQDQHQGMAIRIIKIKILHPQKEPSKLLASGQDQPTVLGIISEAMNRAHQLTMKAPSVPAEYVRKLMKKEKSAENKCRFSKRCRNAFGKSSNS